MRNTVTIHLDSGETIELFENNNRLLLNVQRKSGYDKENVALSKSQIEGLRRLVDRFEVTSPEELSREELTRMEAIGNQREVEREQP